MKVLEVNNISKKYKLGVYGAESFRYDIKRLFSRKSGNTNNNSRVDGNGDFWALQEINFSVQQGEVLGIIGHNGAGKSTLLKVLSQITAPTSGEIKIKGRVASLLEVGTGFHPELTGAENIYLNGAILGMSKNEVKNSFEEIVEFSGIEHHLNTPVKRYSSGMKVRLGFAVAAHLRPEILIVDEVLAVGDFEFQRKCISKMGEVSKTGKTVLFVSHNLQSVKALCSKSLILNGGKLTFIGDTTHAIERYVKDSFNDVKTYHEWKTNAPTDGQIVINSISFYNQDKQYNDICVNDTCRISVSYSLIKELKGRLDFSAEFKDQNGITIMLLGSGFFEQSLFFENTAGDYVHDFIFKNQLNVGKYFITIRANFNRGSSPILQIDNVLQAEVLPERKTDEFKPRVGVFVPDYICVRERQ